MKKPEYSCHVSGRVCLPCNWLKEGFCGADTKRCDAKLVVGGV